MSNLLKAGTYVGRAKRYEITESKEKKTPAVAIAFDVSVPDGDAIVKRELTYFGYLTEATEKRTYESCMYCGWDGNVETLYAEVPAKKADLTKNEVELEVSVETYQGKERNRIEFVNRAGGRQMVLTPASSDKLAMLKARAGAVLDVIKNGAPAPKAAAQAITAPPTGGSAPTTGVNAATSAEADSIPF